ncbi:hypothetical protein FD755_013152 [Muntiacus reevesi]|uniref:Uncharacterized protein n=1 Tax=Muntiacus reevesi TaxID=9886 RepID=A0A5N3XMV4_MUNRE|nr:hypothetical protein FD755_013152 [Muntiacus reevesi]
MYFFSRKWAAETVISTRLRKSEKRKMRKRRAKEIKRGQKEKRLIRRRKERRGRHKKRISVRKIRATEKHPDCGGKDRSTANQSKLLIHHCLSSSPSLSVIV